MKELILHTLRQIRYPGFSRDIVAFGLIKDIRVEAGRVEVVVRISTKDADVPKQIEAAIQEQVAQVPGVTHVTVTMELTPPPAVQGPAAPQALPGVKHIVAIASGKGGVGKSTVSVQLACAIQQLLAKQGLPEAVGIMDCDIYGPSVPLMMGISQQPDIVNDRLVPVSNFGVQIMSMGLLVDEYTPVIWRGPMVIKAIQQFVSQVAWSPLEVLIVDLPPGTGDAQLSLAQSLPLSGVVIVTTPQKAAVQVALRGAALFHKVNVPILGVVETMSAMPQPDGSLLDIFGSGGGAQAAKALEVPLLGSIPLDPHLRAGGDHGIPIVVDHPGSTTSIAIMRIAEQVLGMLEG